MCFPDLAIFLVTPIFSGITFVFTFHTSCVSNVRLLLLYDMGVSCHRPVLPGTSLEPAVIPPLRLQASHCSTFRIMCDVPSIAVFCSESVECFPGTASKFIIIIIIIIIILIHRTILDN